MKSTLQKHLSAKKLHEELCELLEAKQQVRKLFLIKAGYYLFQLEKDNKFRKVYGDPEASFKDFIRFEYTDKFEVRKDELSRAHDGFKWFINHYQIPQQGRSVALRGRYNF